MRIGLRVQILLLLGGLMVLGFVPLYFAVATYTRYSLQREREFHARALGRAIAGQIVEARRQRPPAELRELLSAQVGGGWVEAIAVYDSAGGIEIEVGEGATRASLPRRLYPREEALIELATAHGRGLAVLVPDTSGAVLSLMRTDSEATAASVLVRLVGLYSGVVALGLLVAAYSALTRFIVMPLDSLARAAERVASGARGFDVSQYGTRELTELGSSLRTMTEKLLHNEDALRRKIDEVERATRELRGAHEQLVRSERLASVGRLSAGLAHEIGNPIAALMGMADLLLEGGMTEDEQRDFLVRMRQETERIHSILRDLLQFARPAAAGSGPGAPGEVERAVLDTVALLGPQRSMRDVAVSSRVAPELPRVALGTQQLVQVLLNLVLNAADACGPGGQVVIRAEPSPLGVSLAVEDDGPGVPAEIVDRLFEPFVTTKDVGKGTGLGLAVCRGLVEAAGGSILLDRSYQGGARFVVQLPRAVPSPSVPA